MLGRFLLVGLLAAGFAFAQDEGGGGGGGGGRGGGGGGAGGGGGGMARQMPTKLDQMTTACTLTKDQKKQFKTVLDAASKDADPLRKRIDDGLKQIQAAVLANKSAEEVKKLVDSYQMERTQMTAIEYKAFAELYKLLDPDQQKKGAQRVLGLMSGIFMVKIWDS